MTDHLELASAPLVASGRTVVVSSVPSDSHTWNLVYLELLVAELGFDVVNLGACVPVELLVAECLARRPDMVVVSSVNGHGHQDGLRVIAALRSHPALSGLPVVIGGKLGVAGGQTDAEIAELVAAGFDAVFDDRCDGASAAFHRFLDGVRSARPAVGP